MKCTQDSNGFGLFCAGEIGSAHVMAHTLLDRRDFQLGWRMLRAWLEGRKGSGSQWVHLQWHMLVFELETGRWEDARSRFEIHILPVATACEDALCDAPAALWRLSLAAERPVELPWKDVRDTAACNLYQSSNPYTQLHNVLALAGANDIDGLDAWLAHSRRSHPILRAMAEGLRAYAASDFQRAARLLGPASARVDELGGSTAQNELFHNIGRLARRSCALEQKI